MNYIYRYTNKINREVSKLSEVSIETVRRTNLGISNKKENLVYPLRKIM